MPRRDEVDPAFDGHPERPLAAVKRERTPEPGA
jgi:hypothetical protein